MIIFGIFKDTVLILKGVEGAFFFVLNLQEYK